MKMHVSIDVNKIIITVVMIIIYDLIDVKKYNHHYISYDLIESDDYNL